MSSVITLLAPAAALPVTDYWWHSPSGNIACEYFGYTGGGVDCQTQNNLRVVSLDHRGPATSGHGIYVGAAGKVLPYGRSVRKGGFVCTSLKAGMRCYSRVTGHGFFIWRNGWKRIRVSSD